MRSLASLIALLLLAVMPPRASSQSTPPLHGTYTGIIAQTPATIELERNGEVLTGTVDAGGHVYRLEGSAEGSTADGMLTDLQNGAHMAFKMSERPGGLDFAISSPAPAGQLQRVEFRFQRSESPAADDGDGSRQVRRRP